MFLLLGAFLAGMVTVLAPCVLPLLPIIIGGSVSGGKPDRKKPYIITASLAVSLILFTLLLKATTLLIDIPPKTISYVSGSIIIVLGIVTLFPLLYEKLIIKLGIQSKSQQLVGKGMQQKNSLLGPIITGAALGPVFSSCSPVYAYILATILPANFGLAFAYIIAYVLGLSIVLLLISRLGQRFITKIKFASNPKGWFQRGIAILFIVVGLLVFTGYDKRVQTWVSQNTPFDFDALSSKLIPAGDQKAKEGVLNVEPYDAPEFVGLENWINSQPLTKESLKGKVVLVDFWTYSCINCIRTQPYLRDWHETYKDDGLVIIGVHAPEFAFEQVPANVEKAAKDARLEYPIALDNDFATWNAYKNSYWPSSYLIDAEGKIRRVHYGEGEYKETEQAIRALLEEKGTSVDDELTVGDNSGVPVGEQQTPETYLGTKRARGYKGETRLIGGQTQNYTFTPELAKNQWTLKGQWEVTSEKIIARGGSSLRFRVSAKDVYLVAGSKNQQKMQVLLNGQPISTTPHAGSDVTDSMVSVKDSQLYRLVGFDQFTPDSTIELIVPDGVELNVFTFGS